MRKLNKYFLGLFVLIISVVWSCNSVTSSSSNEIIPFDSDRWEISGVETSIEDYLGKTSLNIKGGTAIVEDSDMTDGIIEYKVAFPDERGFVGVIWHYRDEQNFEKFYIRPHQSGNPDASQYTPVINGMTAWQLYPEYGARISFPYDEWIPVKVVISGESAEIYVNDMSEPVVFIDDLKSDFNSGKVGVETENFAAAYFTDFSFTPMDNPPLNGSVEEEEDPEGAIKSWSISNAFDENLLAEKTQLTEEDKQGLTWQEVVTENSGLINLAQVQKAEEGKNTVFVRTTIVADQEQIKALDVGFSDRIKVYLNDQAIFSAKDKVLSRDYRFLGTVGYYDKLYLPLKEGNNQLWIEVTEGFPVTGWGIQTKFEDLEGISLASAS